MNDHRRSPGPPAAGSPWRLGGLSVRVLAARVWEQIVQDEVLDRAAGLSYYFLFALFPTLLFLTALLGMLSVPQLMGHLLDYLAQVLPKSAFELITRTLREVVRGAGPGLLSVGMAVALWAASSGMVSIMTALNVAHGVRDLRPWWKRRLIAIGLTVGFSLFTLVALLLMVFGERIGETVASLVGLGDVFTVTWNVTRWPVLVLCALTGITLVYYLAPAAVQRWHWVTPGSVFALLGWLLMSSGLRLYVRYFGQYNKTYGSIGGVILLLLWLYLTGAILLIGAEIDSEIARADAARRTGPPDAAALREPVPS